MEENYLLSGKIVKEIFSNQETGFKILAMRGEDNEYKLLGNFPDGLEGENLKVLATKEDGKFGVQYKLIEIVEENLTDDEKYLKKFLIGLPGIGNKKADDIIACFGTDSFNIILNDYIKLHKECGISKKEAKKISIYCEDIIELYNIGKELKEFKLSLKDTEVIKEIFGDLALGVIKDNPYILKDVINIDFSELDKMAMKSGIKADDIVRVKACILNRLQKELENGSTAIFKKELIEYILNITKTSEEKLNIALDQLIENKKIVFRKDKVLLEEVYIAEDNILNKFLDLKQRKTFKIKDIKNKLKKLEKISKIELTDVQRKAIESTNNSNICLITGGPGTGKTTIIKFMIALFEGEDKKVEIAAPTGKAAKTITEVTSHNASTIHKLLKLRPADDIDILYNVVEEIDADVLIIDEMSMVDLFLMNSLVNALPEDIKIILIGDVDQLPSVGPGNVLRDLIESNVFNINILDKVFRQAKASNIISNSYRVKNGECIEKLVGENEEKDEYIDDLELIYLPNYLVVPKLLEILEERVMDDFIYTSQIIVPNRNGENGSKSINKKIQEQIFKDEEIDDEDSIKIAGTIYRLNDRVIQIKNDYDIEYEIPGYGEGMGIYNGEMGIVYEIGEDEIDVKFDDGKIATYDKKQMLNLELAYVITVHKSQGSEFDEVILILPTTTEKLLKRNLLYTAMTRAKSKLIIIGPKETLDKMVKEENVNTRNTDFKRYIIEMDKKINKKKKKE